MTTDMYVVPTVGEKPTTRNARAWLDWLIAQPIADGGWNAALDAADEAGMLRPIVSLACAYIERAETDPAEVSKRVDRELRALLSVMCTACQDDEHRYCERPRLLGPHEISGHAEVRDCCCPTES